MKRYADSEARANAEQGEEKVNEPLNYKPPEQKPQPSVVLTAIVVLALLFGILLFLDYLQHRLGIRLLPHD